MAEANCIQVSLLGGFSLRRQTGGQEFVLTQQDSTSRRLWAFLQYLTVFHQREVSQEELMDVLWWDGESANPANSLKTLLHRARMAVERLGFPDGKQVLRYRRGMYSWSSDVRLRLDVEEFEALCARAAEGDEGAARAAMALYGGEFLPNAEGSPWAVSLRTYYHTKYIRLCGETAASLNRAGRYGAAMLICREAIRVEPYDEDCHLELMAAMAGSGAFQAAIQHYTYVTNLFMDQLGVSPSEEMAQLYRTLLQANRAVELDLGLIRGELMEGRTMGAFFCDYGVFQEIYRWGARGIRHTGSQVQLALLTVLDGEGNWLETRRCAAAMEELRGVIQRKLRLGHIFTRFSAAQYLLLLPSTSREEGVDILEGLLEQYRQSVIGMSTTTRYSLLPMLPAQAEPAGQL